MSLRGVSRGTQYTTVNILVRNCIITWNQRLFLGCLVYLCCVCCLETVLWQPHEYGCLITAECVPVFSDIIKEGRCSKTFFEWPFVLSSSLAVIAQFDSAICQQGSCNLAKGQAAPAERAMWTPAELLLVADRQLPRALLTPVTCASVLGPLLSWRGIVS